MLLELAIGDAYGAGFEYADRYVITKHNNLSNYIQHPTHLQVKPGQYTDDTQMSIAVAEVLVGDDWSKEAFTKSFLECFKRDERVGYARGFYQFLRATKTSEEFLANIRPDSVKNGAAMRSSSIGLLPTIEKVLEIAKLQASITHNTDAGIVSSQTAALMVHYFYNNVGPKNQLISWLNTHTNYDWTEPYTKEVDGYGPNAVRAAIHSIISSNSLTELLKKCVDFGGDVDTVATIALAPASLCREIKHDLLDVLHWNLENGKYGRDYLEALDRRLFEKFWRYNG